MILKFTYQHFGSIILVLSFLVSCKVASIEPEPITQYESAPRPSPSLENRIPKPSQKLELENYSFPDSIDLNNKYLFYLHGKIIEDQGLPAISPDFGEYEYEAILEQLSRNGFVVISDQRTKDTDGVEYARKIAEQVTTLIDAGVPAQNITVVGASKGGAIAIYVSHFLENQGVNFILMAICHPDYVDILIRDKIALYGNVLSIFDSVDEYAGSCQELFSLSEGRGLSRYDEIVLDIGTGHGILYQPLDDWILPVVQWANKNPE
jgi:hypothetical protein